MRRRWRWMAADPPNTDPVDQQPRERGLERRSEGPAVSPWVIVGLIFILGALVYVVSAML
ncbi:hypothetical protein GGQ87_000193 [Brevundimonas alba]|uniref:Uncharacterized protein n=1 Tax=Brevundimonas alba TaxID=74314 RepID=A0A7X6BMQ7_9CAUL|nr:hypothetical protein [Brevundimonas alba]NJC39935.1 hypothetical protein [Brevundimonas alba]